MNPKSFKFSSKDGITLFGRAWVAPTKAPKGNIILVHGFGEHSGRYDHIGNSLAQAGYHLAGFDLRGHGLSEGPRGHSPSFSHLMDDIQAMINETTKHLGNSLPKFLYGHGFGGNLVIHHGMLKASSYQGFVVTSPAFAIKTPPPKAKIALAKIIAKLMPRFRFNVNFSTNALSRNTAIVQAYRNDVYINHKISARLGLDLLKSGRMALENAHPWAFPLLLMHGSADRITSCSATQNFAHIASAPVDFLLWDGYFHELHNDLGSEAVIKKMIQWLDQQIDG